MHTNRRAPADAPSPRPAEVLTFQCANCRAWLAAPGDWAGMVVRCPECLTDLPAPYRTTGPRGEDRPRSSDPYVCKCPSGTAPLEVTDADSTQLCRCPTCAVRFIPATAPWQRWYRPVGKVLSVFHLRFSLHELFTPARRLRAALFEQEWRDRGGNLEAPSRWSFYRYGRPFEFYCGGCGRLLIATARIIAREMQCTCGTVQIVPAPRRPTQSRLIRAAEAANEPRAVAGDGRF